MAFHQLDTKFFAEDVSPRAKKEEAPPPALGNAFLERENEPQFESLQKTFESARLDFDRKKFSAATFASEQPSGLRTEAVWGLMFFLEKIFAVIIFIAAAIAIVSLLTTGIVIATEEALSKTFLGGLVIALVVFLWWISVMIRVMNQSHPVMPWDE